jgi:hypothetical protein
MFLFFSIKPQKLNFELSTVFLSVRAKSQHMRTKTGERRKWAKDRTLIGEGEESGLPVSECKVNSMGTKGKGSRSVTRQLTARSEVRAPQAGAIGKKKGSDPSHRRRAERSCHRQRKESQRRAAMEMKERETEFNVRGQEGRERDMGWCEREKNKEKRVMG